MSAALIVRAGGIAPLVSLLREAAMAARSAARRRARAARAHRRDDTGGDCKGGRRLRTDRMAAAGGDEGRRVPLVPPPGTRLAQHSSRTGEELSLVGKALGFGHHRRA